ncbi:MAG: hypothetical protein C0481_04140 [Phenylobacterium sp.]|uniref:hypothetical protein n=1 Tax=Phenylobacterium sp. TaxID=1871053 RepID=UPI0025CE3CC2|nr:hypothetical protein [Phenylobacterium sp.]MBA4011035.1 hypothetical protein [Phenylobacterium sp.]
MAEPKEFWLRAFAIKVEAHAGRLLVTNAAFVAGNWALDGRMEILLMILAGATMLLGLPALLLWMARDFTRTGPRVPLFSGAWEASNKGFDRRLTILLYVTFAGLFVCMVLQAPEASILLMFTTAWTIGMGLHRSRRKPGSETEAN